MHADGESWNQSWKGCQNPFTQLNQPQYESLSCSMDPLGEVIFELSRPIFWQRQPSEALLSPSPSTLEAGRTPPHVQMLFPKEMEGALIWTWVSLSLIKTPQAPLKIPFCMISCSFTFLNVHLWIPSSVSAPYSVVARPSFLLSK